MEARQPGRWRIWHPYDPTRPDSAAAGLARVGPNTVVWLNEAQLYLAPPDCQLGERIAAALRTLLQDRGRAPVLVLATLWPEHWTALTLRPESGEPDLNAQTRELLGGTDIDMPDMFGQSEVSRLLQCSDARLRLAAQRAENGRIVQYLAGGPEIIQRYRKAPPAARAILDVAIDARRLGHPEAIPHVVLEQTAVGYLDDFEWDTLDDDWFEQAIAYTVMSVNGLRGPLTRIRPRDHSSDAQAYRLADYLEQYGRVARAGVFPPSAFWDGPAGDRLWREGLHEGTFRAVSSLTSESNFTEAITWWENLLPMASARLGREHPDTLSIRNNLAWAYGRQGDIDRAVAALRDLLPLRRRVLGEDHMNTLATRHGIATWLYIAGDLDSAVEEYRRLVADYGRIMGGGHRDTLNTRFALAQALANSESLSAAITETDILLADYRRALGSDHPETADVELFLAEMQTRTGDLAKANSHFQHLIGTYHRTAGPEHADTLWVRFRAAELSARSRDRQNASTTMHVLLKDVNRLITRGRLELTALRDEITRWLTDPQTD